MESIGVIRTSRDGHVGGPLRRSQQSHSTIEGRRARVHLSFSERTDATRREKEGGERKRREGIERRMIQRQRQCELISGDGGVVVVLAGVGRRRVGVGLRVRPVASVAVRELVVNLKASSNLSPNLSLSPSLSLSRPSLSPSWTSIRASHRPANHDMAFRRKISSTRICVL